MRSLALLMAFALFGCGISSDPKLVAARYDHDCRSSKAPSAIAAKQLDEICTCMNQWILTNVHSGDSEEVIRTAINQGAKVCVAKEYPNG